jgi:hypothetical protein
MPHHTPEHQSKLDPELLAKAELLKVSHYFAIEGDSSLVEKQFIFHVLAGIKPVSEVGSYHTEWLSSTEGEGRGDDLAGVEELLKSLGLRYAFKTPYDGEVAVSLSQDLIDKHQEMEQRIASFRPLATTRNWHTLSRGNEAYTYRTAGQLYGYPETAVDAALTEWAYDKPSLVSNGEQDRITRESGLPPEAFFFRFSKAHWMEELATVREWWVVLEAYGMDHSDLIPKPITPLRLEGSA